MFSILSELVSQLNDQFCFVLFYFVLCSRLRTTENFVFRRGIVSATKTNRRKTLHFIYTNNAQRTTERTASEQSRDRPDQPIDVIIVAAASLC